MLVVGETLAAQSVVLWLVLALSVVTHLKIVWVRVARVWNQVDENRLFLTLAIQKELDILIEVAPFLLDNVRDGLFILRSGSVKFQNALLGDLRSSRWSAFST